MKGSRLHLDLYKVFCDLAQCGSFSQTAGRNHLTQSAVSQQISFLERHVGRKLVDRGPRRLVLTESGEVFLLAARNILHIHQAALDRIRCPDDCNGTVRVETVYSIGMHSLSGPIRDFMRKYPGITVHLEFAQADRIYDHVLDGLCHLGVVAYPWAHPSVRVTPYRDEAMGVICSPEHRLARRRRLALKDLARERFIAFEDRIPTRRAVDALLNRKKVPVFIIHEFDNVETLKASVEIGAGISIVPESAVRVEVKNGSLKFISIAGDRLVRPTGIIRPRDRDLPKSADIFVDWLCGPGKPSKSASL